MTREQMAAALLLLSHQSTLSLLHRLWPWQLIRSPIRSSPEAVVHLTGSSSSLALLVLLLWQPLNGGSSILIHSRLSVDLLLSGVQRLTKLASLPTVSTL
jgi:hypothetical protein